MSLYIAQFFKSSYHVMPKLTLDFINKVFITVRALLYQKENDSYGYPFIEKPCSRVIVAEFSVYPNYRLVLYSPKTSNCAYTDYQEGCSDRAVTFTRRTSQNLVTVHGGRLRSGDLGEELEGIELLLPA
jgi:hypothetical protein